MMKVSITFETDDEALDLALVGLTLRDALSAYVAERTPVDSYVRKQMTHAPNNVRIAKTTELAKRVLLAQRLDRLLGDAQFQRFIDAPADAPAHVALHLVVDPPEPVAVAPLELDLDLKPT